MHARCHLTLETKHEYGDGNGSGLVHLLLMNAEGKPFSLGKEDNFATFFPRESKTSGKMKFFGTCKENL